jgi:hypothetical protein
MLVYMKYKEVCSLLAVVFASPNCVSILASYQAFRVGVCGREDVGEKVPQLSHKHHPKSLRQCRLTKDRHSPSGHSKIPSLGSCMKLAGIKQGLVYRTHRYVGLVPFAASHVYICGRHVGCPISIKHLFEFEELQGAWLYKVSF